jgi:hypothetical protein
MGLQFAGRHEIPGSGTDAIIGGIIMSNPAGRPRIYADVELICRQCGETFSMRGSHARGYEKKHGKPKPFCSLVCFYAASNRHVIDLTEEAPTYTCEGCGKETRRRRDIVNGKPGRWDVWQKFCSQECFHASKFAEKQAARASGYMPTGFVAKDGYRVVKMAHGKNVKVHRVVMEQLLGRPLRDNENVHHINGDRADNRPENLELWVKTQPCGQRAVDKVRAALNLLRDYPEIVAAEGCRLVCDRGG